MFNAESVFQPSNVKQAHFFQKKVPLKELTGAARAFRDMSLSLGKSANDAARVRSPARADYATRGLYAESFALGRVLQACAANIFQI